MDWILTGLATIVVFVLPLCSSQTDCLDAYDCALSSVQNTVGDEDINCYGWNSCRQATKIEKSSSGYINCYGGYSCYKATSITTTTSQGVRCDGLYSCANIKKKIESSTADIYCFGELSCYGSKIDGDIACFGDRSCSNIIAYEASGSIDGYRAFENSIAYMVNGGVFEMDATQAGYGLSIICSKD